MSYCLKMNSTAFPQRHRPTSRSSTRRNTRTAGRQGLSPLFRVLAIGIALADWWSVVAQDLQCPDGQVVMEYAGMAPEMYTGFSAIILVVTTAAYDEDNFDYLQAWPDTPTFEPFCVPADKCLTVNIHVHELNTDTELPLLSVIYDSLTLTLLGPFQRIHYVGENRFDFYGQVGASCVVSCNKDQVLLEIEGMPGGTSYYDWQLIDDSTNAVVRACLPPATPVDSNAIFYNNTCYWSSESWFRDRVCVPKDGCYRLVAGRSIESYIKTFQGTFQVTVDGEVLLRTESFHFESVRLQHSESPSICSSNTSICRTTADPSLVEMEIFTFESPDASENATLIWNAYFYDSEEMIYNQGTGYTGNRPLQYNRMCVPDCAIFEYTSYDVKGFLPSIQVQVDGIIYAEGWLGSEVVGSSCQASRYCGAKRHSLVQVGIQYHPQFPLSYDAADNVDSWYIVNADGVENGEGSYVGLYEEWIGFGHREPSMQPGKQYRRNVCVNDHFLGSNGGCTILDMRLEDEQSLETYSYDVSVNGVLFSDRIDCSQQTALGYRLLCKWLDFVSADSRYILLTPLNGNCKTKRSNGSMATGTVIGVVIGVVMGVVMVAGLSYYWIRRRRVASRHCSYAEPVAGIESSQIPASEGSTANIFLGMKDTRNLYSNEISIIIHLRSNLLIQ